MKTLLDSELILLGACGPSLQTFGVGMANKLLWAHHVSHGQWNVENLHMNQMLGGPCKVACLL